MKYIIISLLLVFFFSCTEDITIHTDDSEPVIVIYGVLTDDVAFHQVRISRSAPYFNEQSNPVVSDAKVQITSSNSDIYNFVESNITPGLYETTTEWAAVAGVTYTLKVEVDFNGDGVEETYEASTSILSSIPIDSITVVPVKIMGHNNYNVNLYGQEPAGEDFYLCRYLVNDSLISNKISEYRMLDDVMFDGQYVNGLSIERFDNISERDNDSEEQRKNSVYIKSGDKIELQMSRVSKGYYDFITQCQYGMRGPNPFFGGSPSNVTTNISHGGVGYFSGYCISRADAITP